MPTNSSQEHTETPPVEAALRWLATTKNSRPFSHLLHAIEEPAGTTAAQLRPLISPTESLPDSTPETRALAVWGLIVHTINKIGPSSDSRPRNTLIAAFRLARAAEITAPWKPTLGGRFSQLMALPGVFGDPRPSTTTPMHKAWKTALTASLAPVVEDRLGALSRDGSGWLPYLTIGRDTEASPDQAEIARTTDYPPPSAGAQPLFVELFTSTIVMQGRAVRRRVTERLVTAMEDDVESYTLVAMQAGKEAAVRIDPLWGCRTHIDVTEAESPVSSMATTKLWFGKTLRRGERHHFISEVVYKDPTGEREWIDVEIDHYGIAPGRRADDHIPISGLTIRVLFQEGFIPEAAWWYREMTTSALLIRPKPGDERLLDVVRGTTEYTFESACRHHQSYGIALAWPRP